MAADWNAGRRRDRQTSSTGPARGAVIDFIKLPHWPPFNFADMSVTFGVIILVLVLEVFAGPEDDDGSKRRSAGA